MNSPQAKPIRVVIVDDEPLGRDVVRHMLQHHSDAIVVAEAANGERALEEIQATRPDLVFLDIKMPKMGGLEVLKALTPDLSPVVIFTTAHDEYALQAFERCALDYLLKPFDQTRFDHALARARLQLRTSKDAEFGRRLRDMLATETLSNAATQLPPPVRAHEIGGERTLVRFTVKDAGRVIFVPVESVDWLEAAGNYVELHVGSKCHLIHQTLADVERSLDPKTFLRIHRSTIVNVTRIKELQPYANGEFVVIMTNGTRLKLSRSFRERADVVLGLR